MSEWVELTGPRVAGTADKTCERHCLRPSVSQEPRQQLPALRSYLLSAGFLALESKSRLQRGVRLSSRERLRR